MADRKRTSVQTSSRTRARASSQYELGESFDEALRRTAVNQVERIRQERSKRTSLDDLILSAIRAANAAAGDDGLTPQELASAVNNILAQLIDDSTAAGVLPSPDRLHAIVKKAIAGERSTGSDHTID